MTQFSKNTTDQTPPDAQRTLLSRLGSIFLKKRDVQDAPASDEAVSQGASLPSLSSDEDPLEPFLAQFLSSDGEPTLLSIRRTVDLPNGVTDQVEFSAVHNCGSDRHILSYVLATHETGQKVLHGYAREVGCGPLVSGPYNRDESPRLFSFEIKSHGNGGDAAILARSAHKLAEVFSDHGAWGADEYLHEIASTVGSSCAFVLRSPKFEKFLGDASQENSFSEQLDGAKPKYRLLSEDQLSKLDRVQSALLPLDDLSYQIFTSVREIKSFTEPSDFSLEEDEDGTVERKELETVKLGMNYLSLRAWVHFTSPDRECADSVLFSLRLPPVWFMPSADMSSLKIQVMGPRNRFGLRERYTVKDAENVLEVGDYSINDEAFRNIFLTLHRINEVPHKGDREVEPLLDVLAHYGLHARPASLLAVVASCKRVLSAVFADKSLA